MIEGRFSWTVLTCYALAISLGFLVAWFDVAAPFGDDTEKGTLLLWLVSCGVLGFLQPRRPWRWAILVGPWVAVFHLVRMIQGLPDSIKPNSYTTVLILVPVGLAACLLGAYSGAFIRRSRQSA